MRRDTFWAASPPSSSSRLTPRPSDDDDKIPFDNHRRRRVSWGRVKSAVGREPSVDCERGRDCNDDAQQAAGDGSNAAIVSANYVLDFALGGFAAFFCGFVEASRTNAEKTAMCPEKSKNKRDRRSSPLHSCVCREY